MRFLKNKRVVLYGAIIFGMVGVSLWGWYSYRQSTISENGSVGADHGTPFSQALIDSYDLAEFFGEDYIFNDALLLGDIGRISRYYRGIKNDAQGKIMEKKYLLYRTLIFSDPEGTGLEDDDKKGLRCMRDRFSGKLDPIESYGIQSEFYNNICARSSDNSPSGESYADMYQVTYSLYRAKRDMNSLACNDIPKTSNATNYFLCLGISGKSDWKGLARRYIYARRNDCQFMKQYDPYLLAACQTTPEIWRRR